MPIDPQEMKRLALIRFLYAEGLEQVARPAPLSSRALLSFHDAVEMFLLLAAEHLNVNLSQGVNFNGYFGEIKTHSNVEMPLRPAMRRMNQSRVNLKHHGSIPSDADLEQFRADVTTFLTDATQMVFHADFSSVDMADLVTQPEAVKILRQAKVQAGQGDHAEALALLSEAFEYLLDDYASRKRTASGTSVFTWWPPSTSPRHFPPTSTDYDMALARPIHDVFVALEDFQQAMRVMAVGLDYRRYARFQMVVPAIYTNTNGERGVRPVPGLPLGDDEYQMGRQFVIETALHLAALDFDLNLADIDEENRLRQLRLPPHGIPDTLPPGL
jgi:hypothetical protein